MMVREFLLLLALWFTAAPVSQEAQDLSCAGQAVQGGLLLCSGPPGAEILVSGPNGKASRTIPVNTEGRATVGLLRTETGVLYLSLTSGDPQALQVDITPREDAFRTIEGLDCDKVDARTPEQIAHAQRSWITKQAAFDMFSPGEGATNGFIRPAEGVMSSPFGPVRRYIGVGQDGKPCDKTSVHYGYDIATPIGTPIIAPAAGTVTLADPDLYYEGGTVFLDHGDGLVSIFMHMSAVDVTAGERVEAGGRLGASGNTGRTTGPHLHWAVKWRNPINANREHDFYIDPALLLDLDRTAALADQSTTR